MSGQQWRKALWHLRHGGVEGFKEFRRKSGSLVASSAGVNAALDTAEESNGLVLSVIVPAFNAGEYIETCLRSILGQKDVLLEVVVIDDGSSDDTSERVNRILHHDSRVSLLNGQNQGPARARNRGVEAARGKYIAFVDADDEVLPNAYSSMIDSLERTGSDIATGAYVRFGKQGRTRPKLTARVHSRQRLAVRLDDMPQLLEEPVLWNKVYSREFWIRHVGEMWGFPNYEDQEPVYRALVGAAAIDVLTTDVYAWRLADGRDTRSQHKAKLSDLHAKLEVIEALRIALDHASENVLAHAYSVWMGTDLAMHAEFLDTANKRFRRALCDAANSLRESMPRGAWKLIPAQNRIYMWVVSTGHLDDIEEILGTRAEETSMVPLEKNDGDWIVKPSYVPRLTTKIPKRLLRAQEVDFDPQLIIRNARWTDQRVLEIHGCAYIPGIDPRDVDLHIQGYMDGSVEFDVAVEIMNDNRIDLELGDPWRSYGHGGFRVSIDLEDFEDLSPRGIDLFGRFEVDQRHFHVPAKSTAVTGMIAPSPVVEGRRVTVIADEHDHLSIQQVVMPAQLVLAKSVTCRGRDITIALDVGADVKELTLHGGGLTVAMSAQGRSIFKGTIPELPDRFVSGGERMWIAVARTSDVRSTPVHHQSVDYLLPGTSCVRLLPNITGALHLTQRFRRVSVTGASNDRDRLLITGSIDPPEKLSVVLASSAQTIAPVETAVHADGGFTAVYDLTSKGSEGGTIATMSGGYHVRYGDTPENAADWARVAEKLAIKPIDCYTEWNTLRVEGRQSGSVAITASPPWSAHERTKHDRFDLRKRDWGPVSEGIVFESYNGKSANDNPRALFEAIRAERDDIPLYWSIRDRRVDVPEGGIPVVEGTVEWHRAMATSRVWINNNNFPYYVRKRPGQYYLQTWHGTPIKKLLWDLPRRKVPLTYRRLMRSEVRQWDLLLAQSEDAAYDLQTGLGYSGKTELVEYPRNIRLAEGLVRGSSIRRRFGIADSERVILYVPTWRDNDRLDKKPTWMALVDLQTLAEDTHSTVLVRSHHMSPLWEANHHRVIDMSNEPFVEDLMAIADLLITDYSSIAVDFSLTGKPAVHYVPDLSEYAKERGFYARWNSIEPMAVKEHKNLIDLTARLLDGERPMLPVDGKRIATAATSAERIVDRILSALEYPKSARLDQNGSGVRALLTYEEGNLQ